MSFKFLDLSEDVVCHTLCICDISSVISISQTNKYLHHLAFARTVWMSLLEDLRNRGFVDRLSADDIQTLSTHDLVETVKRLVVGPDAWSRPGIQRPEPENPDYFADRPAGHAGLTPLGVNSLQSEAGAQIVLHPLMPPELTPPFRTEVLRGGKYVLFSDGQILGCWRVADDSLLGMYHSGLSSVHILDFTAEMLPGGEQANIVICIRSTMPSNPCFVEVVSWDFATGVTEMLSLIECTNSDFQAPPFPKICSDVAVVHMYEGPLWVEIYVIINWREQRYCKILCPIHIGSNFYMELIPGHFILTWTPSSGTTHKIAVGAIASLSGFSTPMGQNTAVPVLFSDIPDITSHTIKPNGELIRPRARIQIAVHESPLQRGTYLLWLDIQYYGPAGIGSTSPEDLSLLCSFRLSLPGTGGRRCRVQQRSCAPAIHCTRIGGISYSGHTQSRYWSALVGRLRIFPPAIHPTPIMVQISEADIPFPSSPLHLAPYSGMLAYVVQHTLFLRYF
ncbi:hypothetical protein C8R44DRAFT_883653 [Mycena epipterygia]|nr:hypothetical protein C8R44DRAFT_883653 [Mycena epipterygia]